MELSVLVPLYDGAATVERSLRSLAVIRERARVEVVVVDDGSRDEGAAVARRALEPLGFASTLVLRQANAGSGAARNRALERARGRWVVFLDADDELLADPLALVAAAPTQTSAVIAAAVVER
ncbi:MAG: glycosyltransferase family 2 protein, partial [Planctomycetes bacterium]|nr:glycosyltransferase family 2 protein [Planctomycetota bacterium]